MPVSVSDLDVVGPTVLTLEDVEVGDVEDNHLSVRRSDAPLAPVAVDLLRQACVLQIIVR